MTLVAIDTSVLIGLIDARDVWHRAALQLEAALRAARLAPVHFECTVTEALSTLARRLREQRRVQELPALFDRIEATLPREQLTWLFPDVPRLYQQILALMHTSEGELNFNDGLIALACRERQIRLLASFDRDFDRLSWLTRVATPAEVVVAAPSLPESDLPASPENV
jgi:predicted nucleic acid-binding protein